MSIKPLPHDCAHHIRSSASIVSLRDAVLGLIKNSLDAESSNIVVSVDFVRGNCAVEDDGLGILPSEFRDGGGLGKMHHTSRYPVNGSSHGSAGSFLAALASLSLLTITSHHHQYCSHNALIIHRSVIVARHAPAPTSLRAVTFSHGTRVLVRDLFGSLPVRARQRSALAPGTPAANREWSRLLLHVVALSLAWRNRKLSVRLRDEGGKAEVRLESGGNEGLAVMVAKVLGRVGLTQAGAAGWVKVRGAMGRISVEGCIALAPTATRRCQFISLGIRPIFNEAGTNVLFEEANRVFMNSAFAMVDETCGSAQGPGGTMRDKARKGLDKCPMFYFRFSLAGQADLLASDLETVFARPRDELAEMVDLLRSVCYEFLKKYQFSPRQFRKAISSSKSFQPLTPSKRHAPVTSTACPPAKRTRPSPVAPQSSPFFSWPRSKSGASRETSKGVNGPRKLRECSVFKVREDARGAIPPLDHQGTVIRKPSDEGSSYEPTSPPSPPPLLTPAETGSENPLPSLAIGPTPRPSKFRTPWMEEFVRGWKNPVFESVEEMIPRIPDVLPSVDSHGCHGQESSGTAPSTVALSSRLSKSVLGKAQVISQVDDKFLMVKMPLEDESGCLSDPPDSSVVLIDQHAADERWRLEELMGKYFSARDGVLCAVTESLLQPIKFEVPITESALLEGVRAMFRHWGVSFSVLLPAMLSAKSATVAVTGLPPSILERCRQEPRLLIDLIRSEIYRESEDASLHHTKQTLAGQDWVARFHGCPRGILDLLNSRACRSAVMFNDRLSPEACVEIVQRLARCAFPFQCAHGRPSMLPVVNMGSFGECGSSEWQPKRSRRKGAEVATLSQ